MIELLFVCIKLLFKWWYTCCYVVAFEQWAHFPRIDSVSAHCITCLSTLGTNHLPRKEVFCVCMCVCVTVNAEYAWACIMIVYVYSHYAAVRVAFKLRACICTCLICTYVYVCVQILCMLVMSIWVSVCFVSLPMFACRSQLNLSCCQGEKLHHPASVASSSQKSKEYECCFFLSQTTVGHT